MNLFFQKRKNEWPGNDFRVDITIRLHPNETFMDINVVRGPNVMCMMTREPDSVGVGMQYRLRKNR